MPKLRYSDGPMTIEMDDTLERIVRRAVQKAAPGVLEAIEFATRKVHREAQAKWPKKTGRSRAGLRAEVIVASDHVRGRIVNAVDYAPYIRPRFLFGSKTAWSFFVQAPMRKAARVVVKEFGPQLRAALED